MSSFRSDIPDQIVNVIFGLRGGTFFDMHTPIELVDQWIAEGMRIDQSFYYNDALVPKEAAEKLQLMFPEE